ncbi:MAG: hypothetical protein AAGE93_04255 [Bacteroidota bacterium]
MKRIQLFEFEDLPWFPHWVRKCMTRYIVAIHKLMDTPNTLAKLIDRVLTQTDSHHILDLCSGSGGPMLKAAKILRSEYGHQKLSLTLSDLYPNQETAKQLANDSNPNTNYLTEPVDAANIGKTQPGLRTMICSMHHMPPNIARNILKDAQQAQQPICIYEISDNSVPKAIWWLAIPISFIMVLFITPLVRPMTWQQLVFTYLIPILPLFIAWDGAVSNIRTYTLEDLDTLLDGLESEQYHWEKTTIKGKGGPKLYLLGLPGAPEAQPTISSAESEPMTS